MKTVYQLVFPLLKYSTLVFFVLLVAACSSRGKVQTAPLQATQQQIQEIHSNKSDVPNMDLLYESRSWVPPQDLTLDPVETAKNAFIPTTRDNVKILGPYGDDPLRSLALKIWMIENAQHTIDVVYYIFTPDLVGQAMLGALCNAVQRGVDVRIMVDAVGSFNPFNDHFRALETCAETATNIRDAEGRLTQHRARVQVVIQMYIYQTGKLDSALLGNGTAHYGKLHAKFIFGKEYAFVGTANFDYRSRLFNNEMGLLLQSREVVQDLNTTFDHLKADSYRWGSPEWMQMRKELMQAGGIKGNTTRQQRSIYKSLHETGLEWLI